MLYNRIHITIGEFQLITGPTVSYQYDIEQYLVFNSVTLPDYYTVDFCNVGDSQTVTITGTPDGVRIPDELLLTGRDIKAYVVLTGTDEGAVETRYEITLPVRNRPMRQGVEPTPEERLEIETLVNALNDGVERAEDAATEAESQADRAETAADNAESAVEHYPKIENGYWYVWLNGGWVSTGVKAEGVDGKGIASVTGQKTSTSGLVDTYTLTVTYTDSTTDTITFTVTNGRDGVDGYSPTATVTKSGNTATITITDKNGITTATVTDGTDGVSPGVTITDITGGHRVTITDKDHPTGQSFDVLDGEVSQADLDAALATKAPVIIDTASGTIASFLDGADDMPVKSLVCQINPVQDLHGYDNPWPAGGGKNKLPNIYTTQTINGVTFTVYDDGSIKVNGTASDRVDFYLSGSASGGSLSLPEGNYTISYGDTSLSANGLYMQFQKSGAGTTIYGSATFEASELGWIRLIITNVGAVINNVMVYPMIRLSSVTDATFAPYSNVCPISGWTGLNLTRDGVNVWDEEWETGIYLNDTGAPLANANRIRSKNRTQVKPSTTYYLYCGNSSIGIVVHYFKADGTQISTGAVKNATFTTPSNTAYILFNTSIADLSTYNHDISINYPSTDTSYHAYTGETIPISWQTEARTVYGGTDEPLTGALTKGMEAVDLGTLTWAKAAGASPSILRFYSASLMTMIKKPQNTEVANALCEIYKIASANQGYAGNETNCVTVDSSGIVSCYPTESYADAESFKAAMSGIKLVYEKVTPQTYQLDPITISTLYGQNNIFADCGSVSVDYPCDTKLYIEKLTVPTEDDMIANSNIAANKFFMIGNTLYLSTAAIAQGATIVPGTNCNKISLADALNTLNA